MTHAMLAQASLQGHASIAERIEILFADFQDNDCRGIATDSLNTFLALFSSHPTLANPALSVNENGNMMARWEAKAKRMSLQLEFLAHGQLRFHAMYAKPGTTSLPNQLTGTTTLDHLFSELAHYHSLAWLFTPQW